jgi:hypothetical protein
MLEAGDLVKFASTSNHERLRGGSMESKLLAIDDPVAFVFLYVASED